MMKKKLLSLLLLLCLVAMLCCVVYAQLSLVDSYSEANWSVDEFVTDPHPSVGDDTSASGQSFTATNSYLRVVTAYLRKTGSPTGFLKAYLYEHSGTYGTSSKITNNTAICSSNALNISDLTGTRTLYNFTFPEPYFEMQSGAYYILMVQVEAGAFINQLNPVYMGLDQTSPTHDGNQVRHNNGQWWAVASRDMIFYVYGEDLPPPPFSATAIAAPYAYAAISLMSISLIIGVAAVFMTAIQDQDMSPLIPTVILAIGILIVLFISLPLLNAFSGL